MARSSDLEHLKTLDPDTGQELNVTPIKNKNFQHTGTNNGDIVGRSRRPARSSSASA